MDKDNLKGGIDVQFGHDAVLNEILENGNCIIYLNVLERIVLRWDVGIHTSGAVFRVGKVEDCLPVQGVFLRDSPNWVNLKVRERTGKERAGSATK